MDQSFWMVLHAGAVKTHCWNVTHSVMMKAALTIMTLESTARVSIIIPWGYTSIPKVILSAPIMRNTVESEVNAYYNE